LNTKLVTCCEVFVGISLQLLVNSVATATPLNTASIAQQSPKQLIFIDSSIKGYQNLIRDIESNPISNNALIIKLDTKTSQFQQISHTLSRYHNLDAIHLFSHGFSGGIKLAKESVEQSTIKTRGLDQWGKSLKQQGDILLYGCNIAKSQKGSDFIKALSAITKADVVASNDLSGSPSKNQNWLLEKSTGKIETASLIANSSNNHFQASLDIFQGNAFLYGDNIEVGIGSDGAFGSNVISPEIGRKSYGKRLGYISDPSGTMFKNGYHGDFFLPGYPEEGWGITVNGKTYNNNRNIQGAQIRGKLSNFKASATGQNVTWKGNVDGLEITQVFRIYTSGIGIIVDVTLKNTTTESLYNVYYMRTVDPDNNAEQDSEINWDNPTLKYTTINTILSQGSIETGGSTVSAAQDGKNGIFTRSLLTLSGYGTNSRASYGGERNRIPADVYTGTDTLKHSGTHTADESISIAYKFDEIPPHNSVRFRAGYLLADIPTPQIDIDADNSSGLSGSQYTQVYMLGTTATKISDTDIEITGKSFTNLEKAVISLTNPKAGDKLTIQGELPENISIDTSENSNDTEIHLTGLASNNDYITAIKTVAFNNNNTKSSTETRYLTVQVIDDNFTPSNTSISIIEITVPVTINTSMITKDDIVDGEEVSHIVFTGTAAPNSSIEIVFTDKDGKKITKNIITDNNGDWTLAENPADLTSLVDGSIHLVITSTDENANTSVFNKEFEKDATITLDNITPKDQQTVADPSPTFSGKTDPKANIILKLLASGKTYTIQADNDGNWSITLAKLPLGTTSDIEITAKDAVGNTAVVTHTISTPALPLEVTDLETDSNGFASSTTPTFTGTSSPDTDITITIPSNNGKTIRCTSSTDKNGNWSCKVPTLPSGGPYIATIKAEDSQGNVSTITKELSIPKLPLNIDDLDTDANGISKTTSPTFSGTGSPDATITIEISTDKNSTKTCSTTIDANGNWSCTFVALPSGGPYQAIITTTDAIGNTASSTISITIPKLPLVINTPLDNAVVSEATPIVSGTSTPDTTITVSTSDGQQCTATTDANNNWSCKLPTLALNKSFTLTVIAKDSANNTTTVTHSITTPALPLEVTDLETDSNGFASSTTPTFTGTSKPDTHITIAIATTNGQNILCASTTDENGNWTCKFSTLPSGGPYQATITSNDAIGNTSSITRDIAIPNIPLVIKSPSDNAVITEATPTVSGTSTPGTIVTVSTSTGVKCISETNEKNHWRCDLPSLALGEDFIFTVTTKDNIGNTTIKTINVSTDKLPLSIISPADKGTAGDSTPNFIGTSAPYTQITITASTGVKCETIADASGNWACELPELPVGETHSVIIKAEDDKGNTTTITENIRIPKIPLIITSPSDEKVFIGSSINITGTTDPNTEILVLGPDGETCKTISNAKGEWSCRIDNLRDGSTKHFTVISGNKADEQKITILTLDIENSSEKVNTILSGGGGSSSLPILLFLGLGFLFKTYRKK